MIAEAFSTITAAALEGLSATAKTLPPWMFYDEEGSLLFEQITQLPEYYLTRTEHALFHQYSDEILERIGGEITLAELGAGTATKTGTLIASALRRQAEIIYQPVDVSASALDEAALQIAKIGAVTILPQIANYTSERIAFERPAGTKVLVLYIGSSIGNFSLEQASSILAGLRRELLPGDALLLGTDLAPGRTKPLSTLIAAYDDAAGVTAAFNRNILERLNRECGADFDLQSFRHSAIWNKTESRIEMHLVSERDQTVHLNGGLIRFQVGESIHTENSYKFTSKMIEKLINPSGFKIERKFLDADDTFALTFAVAS